MTISSFHYLWLRKNDSEWLEAHLPQVLKGERKTELKDWKSVDSELAAAIEATARRIRGTPGRPARISLAAIAREVGHKSWLELRLDKLPNMNFVAKPWVLRHEVIELKISLTTGVVRGVHGTKG